MNGAYSFFYQECKKALKRLSKRFKYIMSHKTSKIEIVGIMDDETYFRYHQAKNHGILETSSKKNFQDCGWRDDLYLSKTIISHSSD